MPANPVLLPFMLAYLLGWESAGRFWPGYPSPTPHHTPQTACWWPARWESPPWPANGQPASFSKVRLNSRTTAQTTSNQVQALDWPIFCASISVANRAENAFAVMPGAKLCLDAPRLPNLSGFNPLSMQLNMLLSNITSNRNWRLRAQQWQALMSRAGKRSGGRAWRCAACSAQRLLVSHLLNNFRPQASAQTLRWSSRMPSDVCLPMLVAATPSCRL